MILGIILLTLLAAEKVQRRVASGLQRKGSHAVMYQTGTKFTGPSTLQPLIIILGIFILSLSIAEKAEREVGTGLERKGSRAGM